MNLVSIATAATNNPGFVIISISLSNGWVCHANKVFTARVEIIYFTFITGTKHETL